MIVEKQTISIFFLAIRFSYKIFEILFMQIANHCMVRLDDTFVNIFLCLNALCFTVSSGRVPKMSVPLAELF